MPQGNDLKDAKDIDPLGMTRDLFGAAEASPSDVKSPVTPAREEIATPPLASADPHMAGEQEIYNEDALGEYVASHDTSDEVVAEMMTADHADMDDPAGTPLNPDVAGEQERVASLREEMTRELGTLLEELDTDPQAEDIPDP